VFLVFVTLAFLDFKELGLGLAAAVLIDATIIRGVLLPASMKVLGDWNWYLRSWLEWLPRIGAERDPAPLVEPPGAGRAGGRRGAAARTASGLADDDECPTTAPTSAALLPLLLRPARSPAGARDVWWP
jgi:hypothetical protein